MRGSFTSVGLWRSTKNQSITLSFILVFDFQPVGLSWGAHTCVFGALVEASELWTLWNTVSVSNNGRV